MNRIYRLLPLSFCLVVLIIGIVPTVSAQDLAPGWNLIVPGGNSVCARGTPYAFYVRPGDASKVLIYFQGGGACWNDETCAPGSGWFDDIVVGDEANNYSNGIFDPTNGENPLANYSTVFITYCTGDFHTGNRRVDYSTGAVEHRGAVNAQAALNWTYQQFPRPSNVVIAGCSAGAVGSIYHAAGIIRHYRSASITEFGDSYVGVIPPGWGGFDVWGTRRSVSPDRLVTSLYSSAARNSSRARFAEYTNLNDNTQITYYTVMGAVNAWTLEMLDRINSLSARANFRSYIAPGGEHCIAESSRFYSEAVAGVRFRDWFAALVAGDLPGNVRCEGC